MVEDKLQGLERVKCLTRDLRMGMIKYHPDDQGVLNAGNNAHITTTLTAGIDVDMEHPFQSLFTGSPFLCNQGCYRRVLTRFFS